MSLVTVGTIRRLLVVVLAVGVLSASGPISTYSLFTDEHNGSANVKAGTDFDTNPGNSGPDAVVSTPDSVPAGSSVSLDGSASSGTGNLDYLWEILYDGPGSLTDPTSTSAQYTAPENVDSDTTVTIRLTVTGNKGSDSTETQITVTDTSGGCDNAALAFCGLDVIDRSTQPGKNGPNTELAASYWVDDPTGGAEFENVTLVLEKNGNFVDSAASTAQTDEISVTDNGNNWDEDYTIRITLYAQDGSTVDCREVVDEADGEDPTQLTACP